MGICAVTLISQSSGALEAIPSTGEWSSVSAVIVVNARDFRIDTRGSRASIFLGEAGTNHRYRYKWTTRRGNRPEGSLNGEVPPRQGCHLPPEFAD